MVTAGVREPIVVILLLIALFTAISGRPVNGLLLATVAVCLAWDNARTWRQPGVPADGAAASGGVGDAVGAGPRAQALTRSGPSAARRWRPLAVAAGVTAGLLFVAVVGSFERFSWPATAGVIGLAAVMVAAGWPGPLRSRRDPGELPRRGTALWAGLLVATGLWELAALFLQPGLDTTSSAHPTISALTDSLLASHPGRSVVLAAWIAGGWFLVRR
jgi:hypothetical protein